MSADRKDPLDAMAQSLGDLNALSLEDLGGPADAAPGPSLALGAEERVENSFADAKLDAPAGPGLRSGDSGASEAARGAAPAAGARGGEGLDLALVTDGAVLFSQNAAKRPPAGQGEAIPALAPRGATGIAAPSDARGHRADQLSRPRGVFAWDPVSNWLAAAAIGLLVAALPAFLLASSHAQSQSVGSHFDAMSEQRRTLIDLADPGREGEGPQTTEAVAAALAEAGSTIDSHASEAQRELDGSHMRFWAVWLGLGLTLTTALALLKRRG